jgi:hypothetical protein
MHSIKNKHLFSLVSITIVSTLIFWSIFYFKIPNQIGFKNTSLETIYSNYDGPNYMVIAKCGYNKDCIRNTFSLPLPLEYYPAHFPGYPMIIRLFNFVLPLNKAMLLSTLVGSIFLTIISYNFFKLYLNPKKSYWLSLILIFFPARLFILRTIGAPESWFMATILASLYFFKNKKCFLAAIFAVFAQLLKTPGILLLVAYLVYALYELFSQKIDFVKFIKKYFFFTLVPISILTVFYIYQIQIGDFWAYFNSGDNFHLSSLPYSVFISTKSWINTIWLEDVIYIYLFSLTGVYLLYKKYKFKMVTIFTGVFVFLTLLVAHRDISRYIAPAYPFLLLAYSKYLNKKSFKIIFLIILPAIILYAINFVSGNYISISNWSPFI